MSGATWLHGSEQRCDLRARSCELAVQPGEAMLDRFTTRGRHRHPEGSERERTRGQRVAQPMLVMDRKRLGRFPGDRRRAAP